MSYDRAAYDGGCIQSTCIALSTRASVARAQGRSNGVEDVSRRSKDKHAAQGLAGKRSPMKAKGGRDAQVSLPLHPVGT